MANNVDSAVTLGSKMTGTGVAMSWAGGAWSWLAVNYQAIGAVCAIIGVIISLIGLWMSRKSAQKRSEDERNQREAHYRRMEEAFGRNMNGSSQPQS